jgi:hypothetical protein
MKAVTTFFKKIEAERQVRISARKARIAAFHPARRLALHMVFPICIAIAGFGILTSTIHTTLLVAIMGMLTLPLIISQPPKMLQRLTLRVALSPPLLFCAAMILGGFTMDVDYDAAAQDQAVTYAASEEVARDAAQFYENYKAGKTEVVGETPADPILAYGKNDAVGYKIMQTAYGLMHLSAPDGIDTRPILPLAEVSYGDKTIFLLDKEIAARHAAEYQNRLEDKYQTPFAQISDDIKNLEKPDYSGIFALACIVKNDGEILLATGMPSAIFTDLGTHPAAWPFMETCRMAAVADDPEMAAVSTTY